MNSRQAVAVTTFVALLLLGKSASGQTSTREQFKELGMLKVGRWASRIKVVGDVESLELKAGEIMNGYTTFKWKADRQAFIEEEIVGKLVETTFYFYDQTEKRIRSVRIGSEGTSGLAVWWKKDDIWHWKIESATDGLGNKVLAEGVSLFKENGRVMIRKGTVYSNGKELEPYHDTYRKVGHP